MNRQETLDKAADCILRDRNSVYGTPEDSFHDIAQLWSVYLDRTVHGHDVAAMLALLKIARIKGNPVHSDSWVDLAGYAACGAEVSELIELENTK